jgi:hypothetical protein
MLFTLERRGDAVAAGSARCGRFHEHGLGPGLAMGGASPTLTELR